MSDVIKIDSRYYEYECGDYCCYDYGFDVKLTIKDQSYKFQSPTHCIDQLKQAFEFAGYTVEISDEW